MGQDLLFYTFSTALIASSAGVVLGRHPVHAVLFLIVAFFNAAALFLLLEAEFLALILVIVYVGAVAVLLLFVVMMIDINFQELRQGMAKYAPIAIIVAGIFAVELGVSLYAWSTSPNAQATTAYPQAQLMGTNTHQLGQLLYTHYFYAFQIAGVVLLVAMIGAIVLTLRHRTDVRRQVYHHQIDRSPANTLEICKVKSRQGVNISS